MPEKMCAKSQRQLLMMLEFRAMYEGAALIPAAPWLARQPKGHGQPVMVLPAFTGNDNSTNVLRSYISRLGYASYPWGLGRNLGMRDELYQKLQHQLVALADKHGEKVRLIGWSLGGLFARKFANHRPDYVESVITLGSPFQMPGASQDRGSIGGLYDRLNQNGFEELTRGRSSWQTTPPMPSTAIYSKYDGVTGWRQCVDEIADDLTENIGVKGSHTGLVLNPFVCYLVADRLAQRGESWAPFTFQNWRRVVYSHTDGPEGKVQHG